jgi:hypothetical protein
MLPGLRFLFAATVLSMSILIFGLGAAALLRAAHEEVAGTPTRWVIPETIFAAPIETTRPTLALLRLEPQPVEEKPADNVAAAEPAALEADVAAPPDRIAALNPEDSALPDAAKPDIPLAQAPAEAETAPAATDEPAPADQTSIASSEPVAAANEVAPTVSEPTIAAVSADASLAATKIATLGGPPVAIETPPPAKAAGAKVDASAAKKRKQAQRAKERRRIAQRAQRARQAQQAADPFSQPTVTTRAK